MSTRNSTTVPATRAACIGIAGLICMLMLSAGWSRAETWTVGGGSGPRAMETIASAVLFAADGDTVLIYPGTYDGGILCQKALTFIAASGPGSVMINSPAGAGVHLLAVQGQVVFESLRFTNCQAYRGGAILIEMVSGGVLIRNCIFDGNVATSSGGAVDVWGATVTIDGCLFVNNEAVTGDSYGGAVALWPTAAGSVITDCVFTTNWAPVGGAVYYEGNITITGCTFNGNGAGSDGGAVVGNSWEGGLIHQSRFTGNSSNSGGGAIYLAEGHTTVQGCIFDDNRADKGGDVFIGGVATQVLNCTFYRGRAATAGGALYFDEVGGTVLRSIFTKVKDTAGAIHVAGAGLPGFECNCFFENNGGNFTNYDNQTGTNGNFEQDPEFCGAEIGGEILDGNFRLQSDSPCAPGNVLPGCVGPIGACDVGCGTSLVETGSWGQIKARFK